MVSSEAFISKVMLFINALELLFVINKLFSRVIKFIIGFFFEFQSIMFIDLQCMYIFENFSSFIDLQNT